MMYAQISCVDGLMNSDLYRRVEATLREIGYTIKEGEITGEPEGDNYIWEVANLQYSGMIDLRVPEKGDSIKDLLG